MTQDEKDLLLKDLCARLPYKIRAQFPDNYGGYTSIIEDIDIDGFVKDFEGCQWYIADIKPYLFPLSSMTEEQRLEIEILTNKNIAIDKDSLWDLSGYSELSLPETLDLFDYLNKNNFDYRGLIDKGLALDATGLNIY